MKTHLLLVFLAVVSVVRLATASPLGIYQGAMTSPKAT